MKAPEKIIWSASPTPFLADGRLDEAAVEKVVQQHVNLSLSGLFLAGSCGEGPFMPPDQQGELVAAVKRTAPDGLHVAVQVSDNSAARVRYNMQRMVDAGADSLVIAAPWWIGFHNKDSLRRYFLEPTESAPLPVGIYVRPSSPDSPLDLDLWCEVIAHPNVHFVKDSSSSKEHRAAIVEMKAKRTELVALTGDEFDTVSAADAGYDGCLLGTGILNAGFIRRAFDALAAGDRAGADAWQERSNTFLYDLFRHDRSGWLGGLKYALKHLGIFSDEFLHLSFPQTDEDRDRIRAALEREVEVVLPKALT